MPIRASLLIRTLGTFALGVSLSMSGVTPLHADAGAYLASRQATIDSNFEALAHYATIALTQAPKDVALLESVLSANIARGEFDDLKGYATVLESVEPGNQIAALASFALMIKAGDFDGIIAALDDGQSISSVVDGFMRAWAYVGKGEMSAAIDAFDAATRDKRPAEFFGPFNKAMAYALVGDFESGEALLAAPGAPETRDALIARMQMLSQLERNDEALALYDKFFGGVADPQADAMADILRAGGAVPFVELSNATDGFANVFYEISAALAGGPSDAYTLLYARIALELRPERAQFVLLAAELLNSLGNFDLAAEVYASLPDTDPNYHLAVLGRAETLRNAGREDEELAALQELAKARPERADVLVALGDSLRRHEDNAGAVEVYTQAIDLFDELTRAQWPLFFTRGIAYEQLDMWAESEADLRKALELEPGQPSVLNYLGYSFLELKINLDEAMDMIRQASEARPNDGYITDSLAWGLYRLGRYEEALAPMEKAAALMPVDPIINDHLGDVYWAVGREREAQFQWHRALSFDPEEDDAARIRLKLEIGLDRVLVQEGEEPTRPLNDG
ncbi:tetratricopeptide repeat protein [Celeribacter sp.]|uniref:tetratricopeptide repeat protein n=1 Tax=Celeribacter sp. TaxID=1890673 RepID=UPI003A8ED287